MKPIRFNRLLAIAVLAVLLSLSAAVGRAEMSNGTAWADFDVAVKLYNGGRFEEAYQMLGRIYEIKLTPRQNQLCRLLAGITAYRLGRFSDVTGFLDGPERVPPSLQAYSSYYLGQAAYGLGNYPQARVWLQDYIQRQPRGAFVGQARLARTEALLNMGKPQDALNELKGLMRYEQSGEVRLAMARIYDTLGLKSTAMENYRQAMEASNTREVRAEATARYKEHLEPLVNQPGQESTKLTMVRLLRREWRLEEALALIDRCLEAGGTGEFVRTLQEEQAKLLFFSGRLDQAKDYYAKASDSAGAQKDPYAAWMYARSLQRLGRWAEAAEAYLLAARVNGPRTRDESYLEAGIAHLRLDDKVKAQECWAKISQGARNGRLRDVMLWSIAFYYYHHQAWDQAADRFLELMQKCSKSDLATGAKYWLARSLDRGGHGVKAGQYYAALAASESDFYYRTLAKQRLASTKVFDHWADQGTFQDLLSVESGQYEASVYPVDYHEAASLGRDIWAISDPGLSLGDLETERLRAAGLKPLPLGSSGLNSAVQRLADSAEAGALDLACEEAACILDLMGKGRWPAIVSREKMSTAQRNEFNSGLYQLKIRAFALRSAYLAETGDYRNFVRLQYDHFHLLVADRDDEDRIKAQRRFYPLAYPGAVLNAAKEFNLHPALLLAVIRTESYYHPHIISAANARGLMQLLPSTGAKIAEHFNLPPPQPETLFEPETNIHLGSSYLFALLREFDGQLPLAVASYNAGPFNVKRWVSQIEGEVSLEEFIETIPFDQTRNYVKKILGTFYYYRYLFSSEPVGLDLATPVRPVFLNQIDF